MQPTYPVHNCSNKWANTFRRTVLCKPQSTLWTHSPLQLKQCMRTLFSAKTVEAENAAASAVRGVQQISDNFRRKLLYEATAKAVTAARQLGVPATMAAQLSRIVDDVHSTLTSMSVASSSKSVPTSHENSSGEFQANSLMSTLTWNRNCSSNSNRALRKKGGLAAADAGITSSYDAVQSSSDNPWKCSANALHWIAYKGSKSSTDAKKSDPSTTTSADEWITHALGSALGELGQLKQHTGSWLVNLATVFRPSLSWTYFDPVAYKLSLERQQQNAERASQQKQNRQKVHTSNPLAFQAALYEPPTAAVSKTPLRYRAEEMKETNISPAIQQRPQQDTSQQKEKPYCVLNQAEREVVDGSLATGAQRVNHQQEQLNLHVLQWRLEQCATQVKLLQEQLATLTPEKKQRLALDARQTRYSKAQQASASFSAAAAVERETQSDKNAQSRPLVEKFLPTTPLQRFIGFAVLLLQLVSRACSSALNRLLKRFVDWFSQGFSKAVKKPPFLNFFTGRPRTPFSMKSSAADAAATAGNACAATAGISKADVGTPRTWSANVQRKPPAEKEASAEAAAAKVEGPVSAISSSGCTTAIRLSDCHGNTRAATAAIHLDNAAAAELAVDTKSATYSEPSAETANTTSNQSTGACFADTQRESSSATNFFSTLVEDARVTQLLTDRMCRMRGAALKVMQTLSLLEGALPPALNEALKRTKDSANIMPQRQMVAHAYRTINPPLADNVDKLFFFRYGSFIYLKKSKTMVQELGPEWKASFAFFDMQPFAAASIGQVHRAGLRTGEEVAVKIQFPGKADLYKCFAYIVKNGLYLNSAALIHIAEALQNSIMSRLFIGVGKSIESDLQNLKTLIKYTHLLPKSLFLDVLCDEIKLELLAECDYHNEQRFYEHFRYLLSRDFADAFYVPTVYRHLSTRRVLVTEFISGMSLSEVAAQTNQAFVYHCCIRYADFLHTPEQLLQLFLLQETRNSISERLMRLVLSEIFLYRLMNTDPNPSNFIFMPERNSLALIDFGAGRTFDALFIDKYLKLLHAAVKEDGAAVERLAGELRFFGASSSSEFLIAQRNVFLAFAQCFRPPKAGHSALYSFERSNVFTLLQDEMQKVMKNRERPPPPEIYSLHRKLAGCFLLCAKLRGEVNTPKLFEETLAAYSALNDAESTTDNSTSQHTPI